MCWKFLANWPDSILGSQLARESLFKEFHFRVGIERKRMLRLFMLDVYVYGQLHETVEITVANS